MQRQVGLVIAALIVATQAAAAPAAPPPPESRMSQVRKATGEIVVQPARDIGVTKADIPPVLQKAASDPYGVVGLKSCKQLAAALADLNGVLGPDYTGHNAEVKDNRMGHLAAAGGRTVINSIIPFRSLVREISGAAPADRRLKAAINAGFARRGFLRGLYLKQGCRPRL